MPQLAIDIRRIIPSSEELEDMARRRYQRPDVQKTAAVRPQWYFRVRVDAIQTDGGQRKLARPEKRYYLGFCDEVNKRTAEKLRDVILDEAINHPQVLIPSQVRFAEVVKVYVRDYLPTLRKVSQQSQGSIIETHILPGLGGLRMCDIDALALQRWVSAMDASYTTRKNNLCLAKIIWNKASDWGYTQQRFPGSRVNLGPQRPVMGRAIPSIDQIRALLAELKDPYRAMAEIALYSGMRISEIRGLKWSDIGPDGFIIRRRRDSMNEVDEPKSQRGARWVPLAPIRSTLDRLPRDGEWVFERPDSYESCRRYLTAASKAVGITIARFGFHHLRRALNTLLRAEGADAIDRKAALGHADDSTNEIYVMPMADDRQRREAQMLRVQGLIMGECGGRTN